MENKKIKLTGTISISTSILLIVVGAYLIKYRDIVIDSMIFIIAITVASLGLAMIIKKFRYGDKSKEMWIGVLMLVLGLLAAIFNKEIVQVGLVAFGVLFVGLGLVVLFNNVKNNGWFYLSLGIMRILIGGALIGLAFTSPGQAQSTFALVTGVVATLLGIIFLFFEK